MRYRTFAFITAISLGVLASPLTLAGISDGLMAYYPFDGNAQDASLNGNHGTVKGATLTADRFGKANSAYRFDGKDDSIVIPSSASLNPAAQLSIAFWIRIDGITNTWSPIIFKGFEWTNNGLHREYTVWLNKQLAFYFASAGNQSAQQVLKSSATKAKGWLFYTAVVDRRSHSNSMKVYINGRLDQERADSYSSFNNNNNDLVFGGTGEGLADFSALKGALDDIRFYNRALSAEEINELYTEKPPVIKPPAALPSVAEPPPVASLPAASPPIECSTSNVNIGMTFSAKFPDKEGKYYIIPAEVVEAFVEAIDTGTVLIIEKPPACQPSTE